MTALTTLLSSATLLLGLALAIVLRKSNPFHPVIFLLLLAAVDVLFPAIYWSHYGQVDNPPWLNPLSADTIQAALCYYTIFLVLLTVSFLAVQKDSSPRFDPAESQRAPNRLRTAAWALFTLTLVKMVLEIFAFGGVDAWLLSRIVFASTADAEMLTGPGSILAALPLRDAFQAVVGVGFFYRKRLGSKLFGFFFPAAALGLAALTFLRGSMLAWAITLIFAEVMRRRCEYRAHRKWSGRQIRFALVAAAAVVLSIYVYGSFRDSLRGAASGGDEAAPELAIPSFLTVGHGLLGVSHIVAEYGQSVGFLWGKTYFDMLLLPVPRAIYPSKPQWYGIDDITRGMGWPETTQSAVTMPGEAFANFGYVGLLMALPLGLLLGLLQRVAVAHQMRFLMLGPTIFFQIVSVANWMSFTGIMNALPLVVILLFLSAWIRNGTPNVRLHPRRPSGALTTLN